MAIFRNRFPSRRDIFLVFAACAFPVHSWSLLAFFEKLPSWLLFLSFWDLVGSFAYTQLIALLESAMALLGLMLLGALLPKRFLRDRFVAQGGMIVLLGSLWAVGLQLNISNVRLWTLEKFALWLASYLISVGLLYALIRYYGRIERFVSALVERMTVLLYLYIPLALLCAVIVILRNI